VLRDPGIAADSDDPVTAVVFVSALGVPLPAAAVVAGVLPSMTR
jgi:hypothetical protein